MKKLILLIIIFCVLFGCKTTQELQMTRTSSNLFCVNATLNGVTVPMMVDSGASNCVIPISLFYLLVDMDTITRENLLSPKCSTLADGSTVTCGRAVIRKFQIGNHVFKDIEVYIVKGDGAVMLLGQNVLSEFGKVTFDNKNNLMIIE